VALIRAVDFQKSHLLGTSIFGDGFGAFTHSVLGQFSGKQKPDSSLDFPRSNGRSFVVMSQTRCLSSDTLEDIIDEAVHDAHGFTGNSSIRVNLFQYFVDVDSVAFLPLPLLFLIGLADILLSLSSFLHSFSARLGWHDALIPHKEPYMQPLRRNFED